ncbi:MAG: hypothetical protein ACYTBP_13700, partial [Planctomycetota bacterium]
MRWTLKNSDTARALLDALLLRFALSEHFLNVNELLSRAGSGRPAPVKKNEIARNKPPARARALTTAEDISPAKQVETGGDVIESGSLESIKENWQNILSLISSKLGNGTVGILSHAKPMKLERGVLTL